MRSSSVTRTSLGRAATVAAIAVGLVALPSAAQAKPAAKPDTACMQAGIAALKDAGLLSTVAAGGVPLSAAIDLGVTPREGTDVSALPAVLPFSAVLADHRAGEASLFEYPWCS